MPPWLDTPGELAAIVVAVITAGGTVIASMLGAAAVIIAAWRAKLAPLLNATADHAQTAAEAVSANHGSSLRDAVVRLEAGMAGVAGDVRDMRAEARENRAQSDRAHSEIFHRLRSLENRKNV